ncbi:hypothetical protein SNEBB_004447 [Seison nebaliae]|nr:hypothetical protein SNEBB_004447 [Seison nebaliae]
MSKYFAAKDIENYRSCFNLYAKSGMVQSAEELGQILRSLNFIPTIVELRRYFADYYKQENKEDNCEKEMLKAFRMYDKKGTGTISLTELKERLCSTGEPLSNLEADELFRTAGIDNKKQVNYSEFVKFMLRGYGRQHFFHN